MAENMDDSSLIIFLVRSIGVKENLSRVIIKIENVIKKNKENFCFTPFFKSE